jgi:hypothetical protein
MTLALRGRESEVIIVISVENIDFWGYEHAIRGMRNPLNSWAKSDTTFGLGEDIYTDMIIGENDLSLMRRLYKGGTEHRKYLRQIFVSMDITAPLYWWKEFDTYKVGTVANSCSTMHKIHAKEFTADDFSVEHLLSENVVYFGKTIERLNNAREKYLETKDKDYWWQMIQLLPTSYNQRRTITMNYENVYAILHQRAGHKLDEWNNLCAILSHLPYIREIAEEDSK